MLKSKTIYNILGDRMANERKMLPTIFVILTIFSLSIYYQDASATANYLFEFGGKGSGDGQFMNPVGIAIDSNGRFIVADTGNHRVQVFDSTGKFLFKFGSECTTLPCGPFELDSHVQLQLITLITL